MKTVVLDASVGVKWFRDEAGSPEARDLILRHGRGDLSILVPSLFVYEVFAVASRTLGDDDLSELWSRLLSWRLRVRDVDAALVPEAVQIRAELGCSLYDAFAPAVALQADAVLYSADAKAHGRWPDVVLLG